AQPRVHRGLRSGSRRMARRQARCVSTWHVLAPAVRERDRRGHVSESRSILVEGTTAITAEARGGSRGGRSRRRISMQDTRGRADVDQPISKSPDGLPIARTALHYLSPSFTIAETTEAAKKPRSGSPKEPRSGIPAKKPRSGIPPSFT